MEHLSYCRNYDKWILLNKTEVDGTSIDNGYVPTLTLVEFKQAIYEGFSSIV